MRILRDAKILNLSEMHPRSMICFTKVKQPQEAKANDAKKQTMG